MWDAQYKLLSRSTLTHEAQCTPLPRGVRGISFRVISQSIKIINQLHSDVAYHILSTKFDFILALSSLSINDPTAILRPYYEANSTIWDTSSPAYRSYDLS